MSSSIAFLTFLREAGFTFYSGVPDSALRGFCAAIDSRDDIQHVPAANEGAAVGLGIGWHLASGEVPAIYLQNSGLWNALNPHFTLAHQMVYDIPVLFIVGWRGRPGSKDEPQHRSSGAATESILRMMGITPFIIESWDDDTAVRASRYLGENRIRSSAFLVPLGVFDDRQASLDRSELNGEPSRSEVMTTILDYVTAEDLVVAGIGHTGRELYAARLKRNAGPAELLRDFLCVGGMGYALQVAIGAALCQRARRIWCIEGDGSFLMHLGTAALVGIVDDLPLIYVLLDNGTHASVGGQPTACRSLDYAAVAKTLGFAAVEKASSIPEVELTLRRLLLQKGPQFLWVRIANEPDLALPRPDESLTDRKRAVMELLKSKARLTGDRESGNSGHGISKGVPTPKPKS